MKKKVLIIDDDQRNIFALMAVLRARGFECVSEISAPDGLKRLSEDPAIGVVLMDMMMPEMDGYEAIRQIKSNEQRASLPVFAVTAQAMAGDREKCINAGADEYISKPIDIDLLAQNLYKYL